MSSSTNRYFTEIYPRSARWSGKSDALGGVGIEDTESYTEHLYQSLELVYFPLKSGLYAVTCSF